MAETTQTPAEQWIGAVVHTELGSSDLNQTTTFLTNVFGMSFEKTEGMPGDYYMAYVEGRPSCAVRSVMPQEQGPSQTPYVNVADIDATITKAKENGANIILPKMAVPGQGWMAWMQIPGGPTIAAWQMDPNAA